MTLAPNTLACRCGIRVFSIRANAAEAVGLATCSDGHHSFLLDSRDAWTDATQDGRPRELRCRCTGRTFSLACDYALREDMRTVRAVSVRARCSVCDVERSVFEADIDYEPTDELIERPLDPVDNPWLKARRVELTGFWKQDDLARVVRGIGGMSEAQVHFAAWRQTPREIDPEQAAALAVEALREHRPFDLLFGRSPVSLPANLRDVWRHLPVVHIGAPTRMNYQTGVVADLYYLRYATEDIVGAKAVRRPAAFLAFTTHIRSWIQSEFVSDRAKTAIDNPSEYQRLRVAW